jgi:YhcH/YjgK/YiaL family protein
MYRGYLAVHPRFVEAFAALHDPALTARLPGRYELDGQQLVLIIDKALGRGHAASPLEAHRKYIDIQFVIAGDEEMGWRALADCQDLAHPYSEERDIMFFHDRPERWFRVPPGHFAVFFPDDAHAPLAGAGNIHKAIVKVAIGA